MNESPINSEPQTIESEVAPKAKKTRKPKSKDAVAVATAVEDVGNATNAEIEQLAEIDPVAALLANVPHKARDVAERVFAYLQDPESAVRYERSDMEQWLNMPGRKITRDYSQQIEFLRGKFYTAGGGKREMERRKRQIEKGFISQ